LKAKIGRLMFSSGSLGAYSSAAWVLAQAASPARESDDGQHAESAQHAEGRAKMLLIALPMLP